MKQKKGLILLLAILLVLCIIYFFMRSYNEKQEQKKAEAEKANTIQVVDMENPASVTYRADDGSSVSLIKENGIWVDQEEKETALDQDIVQNIIDTVSDVKAEKQIPDPDPLESYGLDVPAYTITLTGEDGATETIFIGDGAEADYYMTIGEKEAVYLVSSELPNVLEFDKESLKEVEEETESAEDNTATAE